MSLGIGVPKWKEKECYVGKKMFEVVIAENVQKLVKEINTDSRQLAIFQME